jgi:MIP family channel proteins
MNARALSAEFLGTFALVFFGPGAMVVQAQTGVLGHAGVAIVFGLTVASIIMVFGPISGAHINPVATLTMWLSGRFRASDVPGYVIAQLLGGMLAAFVLRIIFGPSGNLGATVPRGSLEQAFMLELILTFWLMLTALRSSGASTGALVGAVVGLEAMMGGPITGASMNPARSFGPALASGIWTAHWLYWLAPTLGALLAVGINKWFEHQSPSSS